MGAKKQAKAGARKSDPPSAKRVRKPRKRGVKAPVVAIRKTSRASLAPTAAEPPSPPPTPDPTPAPTLVPPSQATVAPTGADLPADDVVQTLKNQMITKNTESPALRFGIPEMPFPRYPYAKGPDLANDGVGYGEVLRMTVYRANGRGTMLPDTGYSRRTRSGRQVISAGELTPETRPSLVPTRPTPDGE